MAQSEEYLRRNLIHSKAVGAMAGAQNSLKRLRRLKRAPKWLLASLEGVAERAEVVAREAAVHRDEVYVKLSES